MNEGRPPAGGFGEIPAGTSLPSTPFGPVIPPSPHEPSAKYAKATLFVGVFSIVGVAFCFLGVPFAIGTIAMGFHALNRCKKYPDLFAGRGYAIAGMVCAAIGLVLTAIGLVMTFVAMLSPS